ncbi:MAG: hypothetical protein AAF787_15385, partial [Chloroflexota bacterium]
DDSDDMLDDYTERFYDERPGFEEIDEVEFEDGTFRRSYRTRGFEGFPAGQVDVFFFSSADRLAVLEVYSADVTGNDLVDTFQNIVDSFTLKAP